MRWTPHLTVATVVERSGRFLVVEERVDGRTVLNQPAGHLEDGEGLAEAARRETLEETAWTVALEGLVGVYRWRHPAGGETFVRVCFAARPVRRQAGRPLDAEILRARWMTREDIAGSIDRHRSPMVLRCVDDYRARTTVPVDLVVDL